MQPPFSASAGYSNQSGSSSTQTTLPPNVMKLLDFLVGSTMGVGQGGKFDQAAYLAANPDVAEVMKRDNWAGQLDHGPDGYTPYDHYLEYGQFENRKGVPEGFGIDQAKITPDLSGDTLAGLDMLRNMGQLNQAPNNLVGQVINGDFLDANPYSSQIANTGGMTQTAQASPMGMNPYTGTTPGPMTLNAAPPARGTGTIGPNGPSMTLNAAPPKRGTGTIGPSTSLNAAPSTSGAETFSGVPRFTPQGPSNVMGMAQLPSITGGGPSQVGQSQVMGMNPFSQQQASTVGNTIDDVSGAIGREAIKTVGDRFSMAGRSGSVNEDASIATMVADRLAPYAFNAREADLGRQQQAQMDMLGRATGAYENLAQRDLGAQEAAMGRNFSGLESAANRGLQAQTTNAQLGLQNFQDFANRDFAAQESAANRDLTAGLDYTGNQFMSNMDALNRQFQGYENQAARDQAAQENYLQRMFQGGESFANRQMNASLDQLGRGSNSYLSALQQQMGMIPTAMNIPRMQAQDRLLAGQVLEQNLENRNLDPYRRLELLLGPIGTALSGAPRGQTSQTKSSGFDFSLGGLFG